MILVVFSNVDSDLYLSSTFSFFLETFSWEHSIRTKIPVGNIRFAQKIRFMILVVFSNVDSDLYLSSTFSFFLETFSWEHLILTSIYPVPSLSFSKRLVGNIRFAQKFRFMILVVFSNVDSSVQYNGGFSPTLYC